MAVLSIDLATRRWTDLGVVVLSRTHSVKSTESNPCDSSITCEIIPWNQDGFDPGPIQPDALAGRLNHLCGVRGIRVLMLDGPQAWKSRTNGLEHARVSERQLNTMAKTGLPGLVKPLTCRPYAEFCLDVYDALCRRGWRRLETYDQPSSPQDQNQQRILVESCPQSAWKSLGIKPLPSKRHARVSDLAENFAALRAVVPLTVNRPPNHDQLQAIVAGLPGLALEERNSAGMRIVGNPPRREDGHWREGFIVLPTPPVKSSGIHWLN